MSNQSRKALCFVLMKNWRRVRGRVRVRVRVRVSDKGKGWGCAVLCSSYGRRTVS